MLENIETLLERVKDVNELSEILGLTLRLYYSITKSRNYYFLKKMIEIAFSEKVSIPVAKALLSKVLEITNEFRIEDFEKLIKKSEDIIIKNADKLPDILRYSDNLKEKND